MFVFYTLLYLILTYLTFSLPLILQGGALFFSFLREAYFLFLSLYCLYDFIFIKKFVFKFPSHTIVLVFCLLLSIPYVLLTSNIGLAFHTFIMYFSGPVVFILISSLWFSQRTRKKFEFYLWVVMGIVCLLNVLFYFLQNFFIPYIPKQTVSFFMRDGKYRYLGIALHPTITGFYFAYFIGYLFFIRKDKIFSSFSAVFFLLSGTRSAFLGVPLYIFLKQKKVLKVFCVLLGMGGIAVLIYLLSSNKLNNLLEPSAFRHLMDLFITGPSVVIEYPFGAGLGTVSPYNGENPIIHLESEMYLYMIQLGFLGFVLKIIFYYLVLKKLFSVKTKKANYLIFILLTFLTGCMVFALNDSRFISNYVWVLLGFEFSDNKYKCAYNKTMATRRRRRIWQTV